MAGRNVSYGEDVVRRSVELTREQVLPGLPPKERCGSKDILQLCDERMRRCFESPFRRWPRSTTWTPRPRQAER